MRNFWTLGDKWKAFCDDTFLLNCNLMHYAKAGGLNRFRRKDFKIQHLTGRTNLFANGAARARSMPIMSINIIDFIA